jgi:NTP pyrophosphatase (non-canonical NTP hydrolase)
MIEKVFDTGLTPAQNELLLVLSEECSDVIKAICKIQRHGYDSTNPTKANSPTNHEELERELGDVKAAMQLLTNLGDISKTNICSFKQEKLINVKQWLHFQND